VVGWPDEPWCPARRRRTCRPALSVAALLLGGCTREPAARLSFTRRAARSGPKLYGCLAAQLGGAGSPGATRDGSPSASPPASERPHRAFPEMTRCLLDPAGASGQPCARARIVHRSCASDADQRRAAAMNAWAFPVGARRIIHRCRRPARAWSWAHEHDLVTQGISHQARCRPVEGEPGRGLARTTAEAAALPRSSAGPTSPPTRAGHQGSSGTLHYPQWFPDPREGSSRCRWAQKKTGRPMAPCPEILGNSRLLARRGGNCPQSWPCGGHDASCASSASRSRISGGARSLQAVAWLPAHRQRQRTSGLQTQRPGRPRQCNLDFILTPGFMATPNSSGQGSMPHSGRDFSEMRLMQPALRICSAPPPAPPAGNFAKMAVTTALSAAPRRHRSAVSRLHDVGMPQRSCECVVVPDRR